MKEAREQHPSLRMSRRERMQEPEAVAQMLALARLGCIPLHTSHTSPNWRA